MILEERLKNTDLNKYKKQSDETLRKNFFRMLYRYSTIPTREAVDKLKENDFVKSNFSDSTLATYVRYAKKYCKYGRKTKIAPKEMYKELDAVMSMDLKRILCASPSIARTPEIQQEVAATQPEVSKEEPEIVTKHEIVAKEPTIENCKHDVYMEGFNSGVELVINIVERVTKALKKDGE